MTLLNRADNGHVATMIVLWRTLRALGPMSAKRLEALCASNDDKQGIFHETIGTWKELGMLSPGEGPISLLPPFDAIELTDVEAVRTATFRLLLHPRNCPADFLETSITFASDFLRVGTWALAQDPYATAEWATANKALAKAQTQGMALLWDGDGRWPSFLEWAYFCGLGMPSQQGFIMNPARAIRTALQSEPFVSAWRAHEDLPCRDFAPMLGRVLPVLEGGFCRVLVDQRLGRHADFAERRILSQSTSLALLQLAHEGELNLIDRRGDVNPPFTLMGQGGKVLQLVTHVRRGTPHFGTTSGRGGQA